MNTCRYLGLCMALGMLAACANSIDPPDFAAKNRPLEERCLQPRNVKSGKTREEVQAEVRAAQSRGELDKACASL